jgi:hypothetical protein
LEERRPAVGGGTSPCSRRLPTPTWAQSSDRPGRALDPAS